MASRLILRDLLLLEVGATEPANVAQVRSEIEKNPNCQRVWEVVQQVSRELKPGRKISDRLPKARFEFDAQVIAAYLDGTLEKEQRKQLERDALRTPHLLRELLLHFREQFAESTACLVPWSTTEKLFLIGNDLRARAVGKQRTSKSETIASALSQTSVPAKPVEIHMAQAVRITTPSKRAKPSRLRLVATAAAVTAGLCGAVWIYGAFRGWSSNPQKFAEVSSTEINGVAKSLSVADGAGQSRIDSPSLANSRPDKAPQSSTIAGEWALVSLEEPAESKVAKESGELDLNASVFHQQGSVLDDLTWLKLEGVVALREKGKETWFGPRASARIFNGWEWQTLPGSWVSARLGKLGEIVLDANSLVAVSVLPQDRLIGLEMQAGRIGLKNLSANSRLKVKFDRLESNIEVLTGGTVLGLDWLDGSPRLSVYSGSVRAGEQVVSGQQQCVWAEADKSGMSSRTGSKVLKLLEDEFAWLDSPARVNALSETDQSELLASVNVVSSLNRLGESQSASERVLAQYLPAVLSPEAHLLDVLEGSERKSRQQAMQWLMGLSPRSPKTRHLWRTVAEKSGAPDYTREFFRLVQLARNSAPFSEADARFLASGLKHERLFVREMCQSLLEHGFGNTVRYDAADDRSNRDIAADQWTRQIIQSYSPTDVPTR